MDNFIIVGLALFFLGSVAGFCSCLLMKQNDARNDYDAGYRDAYEDMQIECGENV